MAGVNLNKALPVLVCDPKGEITATVERVLNEKSERRWDRFLIQKEDSPERIGDLIEQGKIPEYAAVIYESSVVKGKVKVIARVRRHDPFMPQVVFCGNEKITSEYLMQAIRAGVRHLAETDSLFSQEAEKMFALHTFGPQGAVVKFGGSAFDYQRSLKNEDYAIGEYCRVIKELFNEKLPDPRRKKKMVTETLFLRRRIVVTVGAGQIGDVVKDWKTTHGGFSSDPAEDGVTLRRPDLSVDILFPEFMADALSLNLKMVYAIFGNKFTGRYEPEQFYIITNKKAREKIPLIAVAPHYVLVRDEIPIQDSDTHTIALAEFYGIQKVILLKRTDGIYHYDPYRGFKADPITGKCTSFQDWKNAQRGNRRFSTVTIDDMLNKTFSREGSYAITGTADGTAGHLMEDSALEYMRTCKNVQEIMVVHIAPHEMYAPRSDDDFEHIVTDERLSKDAYDLGVSDGWDKDRRRLMRDAFDGRALSKIVREKKDE